MSLLTIRNLSYSYNHADGERAALHDISLDVGCGEHIALIGANGSGKTTLFKLVANFLHAPQGEIFFDGKAIDSYSIRERARRIALVPQGSRIRFPYTCLETVLMGLHPHESAFSRPDEQAFCRAEQVMRQCGVWDFANKQITELSGGETQRVLLARAIIQILPDDEIKPDAPKNTDGRLLLLDESLSELDISAKITMMKALSELCEQKGVTVIGIHHDISLVRQFTRRVIALRSGTLAADGTPDAVFNEQFFRDVFAVKAEVIPGKGFFFYDTIQ